MTAPGTGALSIDAPATGSDAELIERSRDDPESFAALFDRY